MDSPATVVSEARREAGLSLRALADLADVSYTTICRIEQGRIDPTVGTIRKLLGALGQDLELQRRTAPAAPRLADLADAWHTDRAGQDQPDWTRIRAFLDYLDRRPELGPPAVRARPRASGSDFLDALLAGIAEKVADDAGTPRPAWPKKVPALDEPWESLGTPRMRVAAARSAPSQLADRGILIPAASLWRHAG